MRAFRFRRWILLLLAFSVGCAGAPPESKPEARPPSPPPATVAEPQLHETEPIEIRPVEPTASPTTASPTPVRNWTQELEEAIQRGDWEKALFAYEQAGRPPLSADLLNRAMARGISLAEKAWRTGDRQQMRQQIEGARRLIRRAVSPSRIPEGFQEEFYFYLVLADSNMIDQRWEREKAIAEDPLAHQVVERMAQRDHLDREDVIKSPVAACPIGDHLFLVVGFQIFDLQGSFRGTTPGLDRLSEGERIPRIYDVFCAVDKPRIQWVNVASGGRGVSIEAEWDGRGFRLADLSRTDLAADTYEKVRQHIEAGELEKALEAYEMGFTNMVEMDRELATQALRQGLAVARRRLEAGDVAGARRALHAAFSIASIPYGLEDETFLPSPIGDWRPKSLQEWAQKVKGVDPQIYQEALTVYAVQLIRDRRPQEAEPILKGLITLAPDYALAYLYLGDALWDQGNQEEARRFYKRYQELVPEISWPERVRVRTR